MAECDGNGVLRASYLFGPGLDEPLKILRGATLAAFPSDGLGSVVAISDVSASKYRSLRRRREDACQAELRPKPGCREEAGS